MYCTYSQGCLSFETRLTYQGPHTLKMESPFPRSHKLPITPQLGVRAHEPPPHHHHYRLHTDSQDRTLLSVGHSQISDFEGVVGVIYGGMGGRHVFNFPNANIISGILGGGRRLSRLFKKLSLGIQYKSSFLKHNLLVKGIKVDLWWAHPGQQASPEQKLPREESHTNRPTSPNQESELHLALTLPPSPPTSKQVCLHWDIHWQSRTRVNVGTAQIYWTRFVQNDIFNDTLHEEEPPLARETLSHWQALGHQDTTEIKLNNVACHL